MSDDGYDAPVAEHAFCAACGGQMIPVVRPRATTYDRRTGQPVTHTATFLQCERAERADLPWLPHDVREVAA